MRQSIHPHGSRKYQISTKNGKSVYLQAVTMVEPAMSWIGFHTVPYPSLLGIKSRRTSIAHRVFIALQGHISSRKRIPSRIQSYDSSQLRR